MTTMTMTTMIDVHDPVGVEALRREVIGRFTRWMSSGRPRRDPLTERASALIGGETVMCPSQAPGERAVVLGVIRDDGSVARLSEPRPVPVDLTPRQQGRLRLAGPCRRTACAYWAGSCQLAGAIVSEIHQPAELPVCPIRDRCRWHLEQGGAACHTCDVVNYRM